MSQNNQLTSSQKLLIEQENIPNISEISKEYDQFKIPANLSIALLHQQAKKIGRLNVELDKQKLCPCCNNPTTKVEYKMKDNIKDFAELGQGYTLYFQYIIYNELLITLIFIISGLHQFVKMLFVKCKSQEEKCYKFLFLVYYKDLDNEYTLIISWINLFAQIILIVFLGIIKFKMIMLSSELSQNQISSSNYSIIVRNIDPEQTSEEDLKDFFEKSKKGIPNLKVIRIMFMYKIKRYLEKFKKKGKLISEQYEFSQRNGKKQEKIKELQNKIDNCNAMQREFEQMKLNNNYSNLKLDKAIVTFNKVDVKCDIIEKYVVSQAMSYVYKWIGKFPCQRHGVLKDRRLLINAAPEPLDIIWENNEVKSSTRFRNMLLSFFISFLLLGGSFALISLITNSQAQISAKTSENSIFYVYSFLCSMGIVVINAIINFLLGKLTIYEGHNSLTKQNVSQAWKMTWIMFINTSIIPFFLFIYKEAYFGKSDLLSNQFFIFLSNTFVVPLTYYFDFAYILGYFKRKIIKKNPLKNALTQKLTNDVFEYPPFDIAYKYGIFNSIIQQAIFNVSIFPFGALLQIIGVLLIYYVSKYIFIKRSSITDSIQNQLNESMIKISYCLPFIFAAGTTLQTYVSGGNRINIANILTMCFSVFIFFIDTIVLQVIKCRQNNQKNDQNKYEVMFDLYNNYEMESLRNKASQNLEIQSQEQLRKQFKIDYDILNPLLSEYNRNTQSDPEQCREIHIKDAKYGQYLKYANYQA